MLSPEAIKMANQVLRDLDAIFPGPSDYQKFKWCWSTDLWALVPVLDDNGSQKFEFICPCGTDVKVHSAACQGMTEARILMEKTYMTDEFGPLASYRNMWALCRWNPPPSIEEWRNSMGTDVDYPANGRYLPVSKEGGVAIVIPPRAVPSEYVAISQLVVRMLKANREKWLLEQQNKEIKRELPHMDAKGNMIEEPHKGARFWGIKDRIKDSMLKFDPATTIGYGGKTGRGDKPKRLHYSDRSLADPNGRLAREMEKPVRELAKEIANAHRD